jgi:hypothetical protein
MDGWMAHNYDGQQRDNQLARMVNTENYSENQNITHQFLEIAMIYVYLVIFKGRVMG